ncbi:MAG: hypothetical protein Q8L27_03490 [archaeon]|nr:hypothetical protein [archaeon]
MIKKLSLIVFSLLFFVMMLNLTFAAYPEPFVTNGVADVAIVVGSGTGVSATDTVAATDLGSSLDAKISQNGGTVMVVRDVDISSVSNKNLIVVGNPCYNSVAASLLGSSSPLCRDAFASLTGAGAGKYLIQVFNSPYASGKIAMLIAGYDAADTTNGVNRVKEGMESTSVGAKVIYPIVTDDGGTNIDLCANFQECNSVGLKTCSGSSGYKTCGDYNSDGCLEWSSVTYCSSSQTCSSGQCISSCTPSCSGKQCGSNGCGGSCGTCSTGQTCSNTGACTPVTSIDLNNSFSPVIPNNTNEICQENDTKYYDCSNGMKVLWGKCLNSKMIYIASPESQCIEKCLTGCLVDNICYQVMSKMESAGEKVYCSVAKKVEKQKEDWAACEQNFECKSNLCIDGECNTIKELTKQASGIQSFLSKIMCRLGAMFRIESYDNCMLKYVGINETTTTA